MKRPWTGTAWTGRTPDSGWNLRTVTDIVSGSEFKLFNQVAASGRRDQGDQRQGTQPLFPQASGRSDRLRQNITAPRDWPGSRSTRTAGKAPSPSFFTPEEKQGLTDALDAETGDILFFSADQKSIVREVLGTTPLETGAETRNWSGMTITSLSG